MFIVPHQSQAGLPASQCLTEVPCPLWVKKNSNTSRSETVAWEHWAVVFLGLACGPCLIRRLTPLSFWETKPCYLHWYDTALVNDKHSVVLCQLCYKLYSCWVLFFFLEESKNYPGRAKRKRQHSVTVTFPHGFRNSNIAKSSWIQNNMTIFSELENLKTVSWASSLPTFVLFCLDLSFLDLGRRSLGYVNNGQQFL